MTKIEEQTDKYNLLITECNALLALASDKRTQEQRDRMPALDLEISDLESEMKLTKRTSTETTETRQTTDDAETRERVELRSKARFGNYLDAALRGRQVVGAEAEFMAATSVSSGIPIELFEKMRPTPTEEHRALTPAPGTTGATFAPLVPFIFSASVAEMLMIEMPQGPSGAYVSGTISTSVPADTLAKGGDAPNTAAAITATSVSPKRIASQLQIAIEDVAAIGSESFSAMLMAHTSMKVSSELDDQLLNGSGSSNEVTGLFERLGNPGAPAAAVETFARFLAIQSGGIDGLWATELSHIQLLVGPDTYRLAAATLRGADSAQSAAAYMALNGAGFATNNKMPAKASHIQQGILCRKGQPGMRLAVAPTWGTLEVDDIYTDAKKGLRNFTVSTLVGDVIVQQPDAYAQVAFRVST